MNTIEINRAGISMAEDAINHHKTLKYNEDDDFTEWITNNLIKKGYFTETGKIVWEIYTYIDCIPNNTNIFSFSSLKLGYIINIQEKWYAVTTISSLNPHVKMKDILEFCSNNKASLNKIYFSCNWINDIQES